MGSRHGRRGRAEAKFVRILQVGLTCGSACRVIIGPVDTFAPDPTRTPAPRPNAVPARRRPPATPRRWLPWLALYLVIPAAAVAVVVWGSRETMAPLPWEAQPPLPARDEAAVTSLARSAGDAGDIALAASAATPAAATPRSTVRDLAARDLSATPAPTATQPAARTTLAAVLVTDCGLPSPLAPHVGTRGAGHGRGGQPAGAARSRLRGRGHAGAGDRGPPARRPGPGRRHALAPGRCGRRQRLGRRRPADDTAVARADDRPRRDNADGDIDRGPERGRLYPADESADAAVGRARYGRRWPPSTCGPAPGSRARSSACWRWGRRSSPSAARCAPTTGSGC